MNTTGIQNYLSNVFRPIVEYDTATSNFTPKLELSNIDTYSGNTISVLRADVGDPVFNNVYVGKESGNSIVDPRACRNVSAFGYAAGSNISNDSNSVYVGYYAGAGNIGTWSTIAIGSGAGGGGTGVSNIFIGTGTKSTLGSNNIFLGHGIDLSGVSNQLRIGFGTSIPIAANLTTKWVGLNGLVSPLDVGNLFDVSGNARIQGQLALNRTPGVRTLDVNGNFRAQDSSMNTLDFSNGVTRSTGGYVSYQADISVNAVATTIGQLKKGIVMVSAVDRGASSNYASRLVLAYTTSNVAELGSNVSTMETSITISGSNIQITDTTNDTTYAYNITYFPLP